MGHHHTHDHSSDVKNIKAAFFLNLLFTIVEIIGGLYVNSMAILSDAVHDLGDSLSLGFSWYFQKLSKKGRDKTFSYGYKRFSVLGAIINSIVLVAGSLLILAEAVPRLWQPVQPDAQGMLLLSILGIIINGAAVLKMKKGESINEKVVSLHLLEDVLGWVAVLIGSIVMIFYDVPILDPLLSLFIAGFIMYNVVKNLKASFKIILQANPQELNQEAIKEKVLTVPKVKSVHDLHSWTMDGNYHIMSIHIVLEKGITMGEQMEVKSKVREVMGQLAIDHVTIEVDCVEEPCELEDC